jgi:hypothetical protein
MRLSRPIVLGIAALFLAAVGPSLAQPTLSSSLTDWGNISIFGPAVTKTGGAKTEIVGQRTQWDHDFDGVFNPLVDGRLEQNVWTEASVMGGAPIFRSYHDLKGFGIPLNNGRGWTGFRTDAGYSDTWTITDPAAPMGAPLSPVFTFGVVSRLGHLFPAGGTVALPTDFYPYNPLWGSPPGSTVIGPLPTAPQIEIGMNVDNFHWYDYQNVQSNVTTSLAMGPGSIAAGALSVLNGVPFAVQIDFVAGWRMEHSDIVAVLGPSFERFSTNRVFDASHTAALSEVAVYDEAGMLLQGWTLTDSKGLSITPITLQVAEPSSFALFSVGGLMALVRALRRRASMRVSRMASLPVREPS